MPDAAAPAFAPPGAAPDPPTCRCCGAPASETFVDLGPIPLGAALHPDASAPQAFRDMHLRVCSDCRLVQLPGRDAPSPAPAPRAACQARHRLDLAERCAADVIARFGLHGGTPVAAVGEPGPGLATFAARGIPTDTVPPGAGPARSLRALDRTPALLLAEGLLEHAGDLHDVLAGLRTLLAPGGVLVIETPYLPQMMRAVRLDAIRHDRLSWFSLGTVETALVQHGLAVFDVAETAVEPGSLRLFARHVEDRGKPVAPAVEALRQCEATAGLGRADAYRGFSALAAEAKCALLDFLIGARRTGRRVAGHVGAGCGVTLLNYCGVGPELLPCVADEDPWRQGLLLPGRRIPIRAPEEVLAARPDFLLVLDDERAADIAASGALREWGGRVVLPGPAIEIL